MPEKGTQYELPLILQLVNNREEQRAADAQKNPEERDDSLQFFTRQPTEGVDFELVMEWLRVFFRIFSLSLFSGIFYLVWVFALELAGH